MLETVKMCYNRVIKKKEAVHMYGDIIRKIRKELKLNQLEFAKGINVSRSLVGGLEKEYTALTDRVKEDIIRVYNVNPEYLESGIEPMFLQEPRQREEIKRLLPKLESLTVEQLESIERLIDVFKKVGE